jgi:WD40 repeat protein
LIAAAFRDEVDVWQTETGALARRLPLPVVDCDEVWGLAFSPDGAFLAAGVEGCHVSYGRGLLLWSVASGEIVENLDNEYTPSLGSAHVADLAYSPEGKYLALGILKGFSGPSVLVVDTKSGKVTQSLARDATWVEALTFSADGKLAAQPVSMFAMMLPHPGPVTVWEAASGRQLGSYKGCSWLGEKALAFSPDGKTLAAGDWHGSICSWDVKTGEEYPALRVGHAVVRALAFSDDGKMLASVTSDGALRLFDTGTGREARRCRIEVVGPRHHDWTVAFSPGARMLATGGKDRSAVHVWDARTCAELWRFSR